MLALARGLEAAPRMLLLDEPSLGLSPKLAAGVFDLIRRLRDQGFTVLLVEQNVRRTLALADIADAEFTVGADMPSMPGTHNVRPVPAEPHGTPGVYRARIELEMTGEWALKLDFTRPGRDRLIRKLHFGTTERHGGHKHE